MSKWQHCVIRLTAPGQLLKALFAEIISRTNFQYFLTNNQIIKKKKYYSEVTPMILSRYFIFCDIANSVASYLLVAVWISGCSLHWPIFLRTSEANTTFVVVNKSNKKTKKCSVTEQKQCCSLSLSIFLLHPVCVSQLQAHLLLLKT